MNITEDFIAHFTGNASTASNGRKLASDGSFESLHASPDGTLIFGLCKGSGKNPYNCSVDFADPEKPVPRCSCPSRQIPCKHVAGLLYCRLQGRVFAEHEVPDDIAEKRTKASRRAASAEKKLQAAARDETNEGRIEAGEEIKKPAVMTRAKANAAIKKCGAQLAGIGIAEKILHNIVKSGLHSIDSRNRKLYEQQAKELGNYYIPGLQAAVTELLLAASEAQKNQGNPGGENARNFGDAVVACGYLHALIKKSRAHTENKIADCEAFIAGDGPTDRTAEAALNSRIEEQMGHAWKLAELGALGRRIENAELLQVGFNVRTDAARREFVDEGIWICLTDGGIYVTRNLRPFKAQKHVRADDTFFPILMTPELFIYPGDRNPRVRWERSDHREATSLDRARAASFGARDYAAAIKAVRAQIKNPLADKNPIYALRVAGLGEDERGDPVVLDETGTGISLRLDDFGFLMRRTSREQAEGATLVCRFDADIAADRLVAAPVALIAGDAVLRFTF